MYGLIQGYLLIIWIRVLDRTVFHTGSATSAFVFQDVPGLFNQDHLELTRFSFHTVNLSIGEDLYIGMPADLDQFGREDSHGAVIGRESLVKLGHMAPDARCLFDQVYLKTA